MLNTVSLHNYTNAIPSNIGGALLKAGLFGFAGGCVFTLCPYAGLACAGYSMIATLVNALVTPLFQSDHFHNLNLGANCARDILSLGITFGCSAFIDGGLRLSAYVTTNLMFNFVLNVFDNGRSVKEAKVVRVMVGFLI